GLTMGCARCHDHKYDPISRRDFYQFFAFFNNVDEQGVYTETRGNVAPLLQVPTAEETEKLAEFDRQIVELEQQSSHTEVDAAQFLGTADDMSLNDLPTPQLQLLFNQQLLAQAVPHEATKRASAESVRFTGESIPWKEGPIGAGVDFSGDPAAYVDAGQAFVIDADRPFSWSLWARVDGPGAFLSKMDDQHGFRGYDTIVLDDFRLKVHLIDTWPNNALAVTTKSAVPKDKWFHLTVSYDGSRQAEGIHLWLDGRPLALNFEQRNLSGSLLTDQPLRLGRRSTALYFDGSIADVRFYTQSLTAEQDARMLRRDLHARLAGQPLTADTIPPTVREYLKSQQNHELQEQLQTLRSARESLANSVQTTMIMRDRSEYRPTYLLRRGQYDLPDESEALWPQLPEFLGELPTDAPRNRLGLAHSLIQPDHPLVARVMVNRIWQRMFGRGIVPTPDNFGVQGDPPSHPELLDWLAIHFIESGWDVKQLHKMIALSATYRQSARSSAELQARDPYNRLLARGPRHRLPAELVRDNALAVSGLLSSKIGGPSVKPYQPAGLWDELAGGANGGPYQVADGPDLYRRSLYTFRKRTVSHPTLGTFDAPSWEICQAKRPTTNTPLQALALLNDLTYVEAAAHLAVRMQSESSVSASASDRIRLGFELALLRSPSDQELSTLEAGFAKYADFYRSRPESAKQFLSQGKSQVADDRKTPELAALATIAAVILNLDETITE
ncbi:MAG: DUF1553 domain-containing protein, partial [Planctomycetales bacterium]|nr:DUF1553 domain-containing protein [Planctomycetales bacterium]